MADEEREESPEEKELVPVDPAVLLPTVEKQLKATKFLLITTLALSVLVLSTVGVGIGVMYGRIVDLEVAALELEDDQMEEQFIALEDRLLSIAEFRRSEQKNITKYTKELAKLSNDCSAEKAEPFLRYLSQREDDFQLFVGSVKSGISDLAGMNIGSKLWLGGYTTTMDGIVKLSADRKLEIDKLL
ncbi:MAG: hypothetical protein ACI92E_002409 [Oceanicoccus sp.]|jgi:hypothetical protein